MQDYRAYVIGSKGRIRRRIDFLCDNDEAARHRAENLVNGHDVELWQLNRMVCELKAKRQARLGQSRFRSDGIGTEL
ncbi:hypothetical protein [Bradyrhizobium sp. LTSP885]|uniref:hypothetical protein n=1 Tax=Bradyrhizobium sp. LTSP885 TaxID=1619232 RepID=UPI0005CAB2A4|nr:hypothetical protein [Bradyrhizobium sp. LTSP885]